MRITNNMATQLAIESFATARQQMNAAQLQVSTGRRFEAASEDPVAASGVMRNDEQLRALDQYRQNAITAGSRVALEEGVLDQLSSLLTRAREIGLSQASDTASQSTRRAAGAEVNQLLGQAVQLANTKSGDEFLFGGETSTTAPFGLVTAGAAYTFTVATPAPTGVRRIEISSGQFVTTNHDGTTLFGTAADGTLKALQDLAGAMQTGTTPAVSATLDAVVTAFQRTQMLTAETGARSNQIQSAESNITALSNQLTMFTSDLRDVDIESAMTTLVGRQTAYQAAMAATSRVMNLSLTDYLR